jgi:CopG-like RHH_1 or ribbon-helix-helix domain, RHH_5
MLATAELMTTKRPKVMVYLDDEQLKADLEALAAYEGRSLSNLFNRLAKNAVEQAKADGYIE